MAICRIARMGRPVFREISKLIHEPGMPETAGLADGLIDPGFVSQLGVTAYPNLRRDAEDLVSPEHRKLAP